ncbi:MAG: hypothetical protein AAF682_28830 [Planctomycetota bacterium]
MRFAELALFLLAAAALVGSLFGRVSPAELPGLPPAPGRALDAAVPRPAAQAGAEAQAEAPEVEGSGTADDPLVLDFSLFTFPDYDPPELRGADPEPLTAADFPPAMRAADGKHVRLQGFMITVDFRIGTVQSFMLARFPPGCCFGATPVFDEWVDAHPGSDGVIQRSGYAPLAVTGVLEVGEELDEDGFVRSLYRLRDAEVEDLR